ncbi:VWA domain-containing protein [Streptomyces sp. 142MFCol3.1]|uniref:VWA domain-containing protein n=1 Tax=Streptomyces sp. 142MFCol3.1 TaxID=1172179 RepID=UPI0003F9C0C7|nr:VWA domain-containing protein [Streptomyces sp. 142MFCol3.1]
MPRFEPRGEVNRALLVGVSAYDSTRPNDPHGVPGDLAAVAHNVSLLEETLSHGGVFRKEEVVVSRSPYLDAFSESLRIAADEAEGLLLFYFAGHGAVPSAGDELWLQMRNARVVPGSRAVFPGADPFSSVLTVLATSRARHVVVVLDCCNAGNAAQVCEALADRRRFSVLMSVQANNRIDAGDDATPTPFTARLVRLLHDGVDGQGTDVGFRDLSEALTAQMSAHHKTLRNEPWEPQRWGDTDVLLSRPSARAPSGFPATFPGDPPQPVHPLPSAEPPDETAKGTAESRGEREQPSGSHTPGRPSSPSRPRPGEPARAAEPPWWRRLLPGLRSWGPAALSAAGLTLRLLRSRPRRTALVTTVLVGAGLGGYLASAGSGPGQSSCGPPLELRLLTDPDIESTVRTAADVYLTSPANTTTDGCRRSGITVYSAGATDAVTGFRDRSDPWQRPVSDDLDPQRDIGPQPDIWIPASSASVARAQPVEPPRTYLTLESHGPFAYSPMVLAVPQNIAEDSVDDRTGGSLAVLRKKLVQRQEDADVRRTDPEFTDSALLATVGLYGPEADGVSRAEGSVAQPGPPSHTGSDLLCTLPDDRAVDDRTAALVPEFLMVSGVGCDRPTRSRRMAEYPTDVPALDPTFVRVRWEDADRDRAARDEAVDRFRSWLTRGDSHGGKPGGGLDVFGQDGFRAVAGAHDFLATPDTEAGTLAHPGALPAPAAADAMTTALRRYRNANGPGRVLFLLDSSGSMGGLWEGPGGAPGILKQSLGGLGDRDEYGVWAVASHGDGPSRVLLPFDRHRRSDAERTIDRTAAVQDTETDPYAALTAALDYMAGRGKDDDRPQLIVYVTDDEDNNHLTRAKLDGLVESAGDKGVPVVIAALDSGGCDRGKPDARVSDASGGRCLDTKTDLVAGLRDEVARTGTGDE